MEPIPELRLVDREGAIQQVHVLHRAALHRRRSAQRIQGAALPGHGSVVVPVGAVGPSPDEGVEQPEDIGLRQGCRVRRGAALRKQQVEGEDEEALAVSHLRPHDALALDHVPAVRTVTTCAGRVRVHAEGDQRKADVPCSPQAMQVPDSQSRVCGGFPCAGLGHVLLELLRGAGVQAVTSLQQGEVVFVRELALQPARQCDVRPDAAAPGTRNSSLQQLL
mmetsp:Transcript_18577/g.46496  ORF Transcript_18577/g.46496 Transcript_18577/m.46496 type:complete len:221 (+) Transcript_18577:533-1195(+)